MNKLFGPNITENDDQTEVTFIDLVENKLILSEWILVEGYEKYWTLGNNSQGPRVIKNNTITGNMLKSLSTASSNYSTDYLFTPTNPSL